MDKNYSVVGEGGCLCANCARFILLPKVPVLKKKKKPLRKSSGKEPKMLKRVLGIQ